MPVCILRRVEPDVRAYVAQLVEHVLGKDEVSGSIPLVGSSFGREEKQGMLKEPNAGDGVEI